MSCARREKDAEALKKVEEHIWKWMEEDGEGAMERLAADDDLAYSAGLYIGRPAGWLELNNRFASYIALGGLMALMKELRQKLHLPVPCTEQELLRQEEHKDKTSK